MRMVLFVVCLCFPASAWAQTYTASITLGSPATSHEFCVNATCVPVPSGATTATTGVLTAGTYSLTVKSHNGAEAKTSAPFPLTVGGSTPPPPPPTIGECYSDGPGHPRVLPNWLSYAGGLTREKCIAAAKAKGFPWAGVEYSHECYGGATKPPDALKRPAADCNMKCSGDATQICGGGWRINLLDAR